MSAKIFIEGGAKDSKVLRFSCQRAFRKLLEKMGLLAHPRPKLIACAGRDQVFGRFCKVQGATDYIGMWIDSEEPITHLNRPWDHLRGLVTVRPWLRPVGADDNQVLFMTTSMETWIAADRNALRTHFGYELNEHQLPPLQNLENRQRGAVFDSLRQATQHCKARYDKGETAFELFERLSPAALQSLPSFVRTQSILKNEL